MGRSGSWLANITSDEVNRNLPLKVQHWTLTDRDFAAFCSSICERKNSYLLTSGFLVCISIGDPNRTLFELP